MSELIKIDAVEPRDGHWLRLTFTDGAVKDVDIGDLLAPGGVFSTIRDDRHIFEQARVNSETRTIEWRRGSLKRAAARSQRRGHARGGRVRRQSPVRYLGCRL